MQGPKRACARMFFRTTSVARRSLQPSKESIPRGVDIGNVMDAQFITQSGLDTYKEQG